MISRQSAACREAERQAFTRNEAQAHSFEDHSPRCTTVAKALFRVRRKQAEGFA